MRVNINMEETAQSFDVLEDFWTDVTNDWVAEDIEDTAAPVAVEVQGRFHILMFFFLKNTI